MYSLKISSLTEEILMTTRSRNRKLLIRELLVKNKELYDFQVLEN